jgi:hypothetical protein
MLPITFLSPLFLIGVLAAAIPLIIHLSRSRRVKKMSFSTTRFFTDQFLRSYRMSRLKELFLLACRMALCALLAMALARPLYLPKGQSFLVGGSRAIALVIDNSASMGYTENGLTLLDRSRAVARDLLDGLGANDRVSVLLAGRREGGPEVLYENKPIQELGDVLQAINTIPVAALGTDLPSAVARAHDVLSSSTASSKEVYVLSDLQEASLRETAHDDARPDGSDVLHFFVRVRPQSVSNLAVTAVQYATARPMMGVPFLIRAHVAGIGEPARGSEVRLVVDGQKVSERHLDKLPNGRWAVPRFHHTFATGGWHSGYVEVDDENLTLDNRRYFAIEVLDGVKVLAVNGAPSQVARLDELFFLRTALTASSEGKGPINLDSIGPAELAAADLGKYPLVILANVESLSSAAVEKLEGLVDRGGSLLIFLGDKVNPAFYNEYLAGPNRPHGGLLPGRLLDLDGSSAGPEAYAFVSQVDYDHPALNVFDDPKFANLTSVTFRALWKMDPGSGPVLMRASTGSPLLCERSFGKGRVLLFTSSCDRDWTNFPVRPAYLPWVHRLVTYLAQEPAGYHGAFVTGDWIPVPVATVEKLPQILVEKFDVEKKAFYPVGTAAAVDDPERPLVFQNANQAGIYRIGAADNRDTAPLVAVNLPGYESNLTYLDDLFPGALAVEQRLKEIFPELPLITYVEDPARLGETSLSARRGVKLWDIVLALVLLIALFEPWLANRISLRHYARPREVAASGAPPTGRPVNPSPASQKQEVSTR